MKKNYYEILEVSKNASKEVIEKAYKALVKKYHPDLRAGEENEIEDERIREINEAYEVISDENKRKAYDLEMQNDAKETEDEDSNEENNNQKEKEVEEEINEKTKEEIKKQILKEQYEIKMQEAIEKAYQDAYIDDMKNRGYTIKYKKSFKDYIKSALTIVLTLLIIFLIIQIPFVKKFFIDQYTENEFIKTVVDFIIKMFNTLLGKG